MKNKTLIKTNLAMMVALGMLAGAANAAVTTKAITLGWAGTIPSAPSVTGDWKFVDILTGADYVPNTGKLDINNGSTVGTKSLVMDDFQFGIKATTGTLKAASKINAYLAFPVTFTGLNATSPTAVAPSASLTANGVALSVGAANAATLTTIGATPTQDAIPVSVAGKGVLPLNSFSAGDSVSVNATVMFSAEV
ncbi:hypothetical protein [Aeromonas veronii]|uniref:hypothetical protein n=1 Tax=Aeromonas veronii TaxID=654 RepID=UPI003D21C18A